MRYSFHGKVRATGQQVDGYVEANSSAQAIDLLADQGIIGVYSVRAEPVKKRNAVVFSGQEITEEPETPQAPPALPAPAAVAAPQPAPPVAATAAEAPRTTQLQAAAIAANPAVLQQLVDQVQVLVTQVEKLLSRPAQVVYQSGPIRGGGGGGGEGGGKKKSARVYSDAQNSTLRDIFQNNLDLRRSLEKLATTAGPKPADGHANGSTNGAAHAGPVAVSNGAAAHAAANGAPSLAAGPIADVVASSEDASGSPTDAMSEPPTAGAMGREGGPRDSSPRENPGHNAPREMSKAIRKPQPAA